MNTRERDLEWIGERLAEGFVAMAKTLEDAGMPERIGDIVAQRMPRCTFFPNGGWYVKAPISGAELLRIIAGRL